MSSGVLSLHGQTQKAKCDDLLLNMNLEYDYIPMVWQPVLKQENFNRIVYIPYLFGYKTGLSLSRMSTNNQISPMQFCSKTGFTLPKQSQRSRSIL